MYPISDKLAAALRRSFRLKCTVEVWYDGNPVATLPVNDGSVTVDRTSSTRRSIDLTIASPDFVPLYVNSPLAPYGAELRVFSGIVFMDGSDEQVPLGVFRIESVDWEEESGSFPLVKGYDRSKGVIDAKFLMPYDASGRSAFAVLSSLVTDVVNCDVLIDPALRDYVMPGGSVFDSERWDAVQSICAGMGAEAYFDVYGNLVVTAIPSIAQDTPHATAVWSVNHGPDGVLVSAQRGITRTGVYNAVAATGSATDSDQAPPIGFAADTDPRSPTYWGPATALPYGPYAPTPFGQAVMRYSNNLLTTTSQCETAARGQLANSLGLARSLSFGCVPNPALDAGDLILVEYLSAQSELHLIDTLEIPLAGGDFGGTTRTLTYQSSGGS